MKQSIEGKRIYLRPYQEEDIFNVFSCWASDERLFEYVSIPCFKTVEETSQLVKSWINENERANYYHFAIIDKKTNTLIGDISAVSDPLSTNALVLSFILGYDYWHQGLMSEAIKLFFDYLFKYNRSLIIKGNCYHKNTRSLMIFLRFGFTLTNTYQRASFGAKNLLIDTFMIDYNKYLIKQRCDYVRKELVINNLPDFSTTTSLCEYISLLKDYYVDELLSFDKSELKQASNCLIYLIDEYIANDGFYHHYFINRRIGTKMITTNDYFNEYVNIVGYYSYFNGCKKTVMLENKIVWYLDKLGYTITTAESCTGGLIMATLINTSGASHVVNGGMITYSEDVKMALLNVRKETLDKYSVYSKEVSIEMAKGAKNLVNASVSIGITGYASGDETNEHDGSFDVTIIVNDSIHSYHYQVKGSRNEIRKKQVYYVLLQVWNLIKDVK